MTVRPPLFTARIDHERATVRARGRLDPVTADLLRGTLETPRRGGHRALNLELAHPAGPDDDGVLRGIVEELSAGGARIVVRRKPSWHQGPPSRRRSGRERPRAVRRPVDRGHGRRPAQPGDG